VCLLPNEDHQLTKYRVEDISLERNVLGLQRFRGLARCLSPLY
jgi:hypothetical protein